MSAATFSFVSAGKVCRKIFGSSGQFGELLNRCLEGQSEDTSEFICRMQEAKNRADFRDDILNKPFSAHYTKTLDGNARQKLAAYRDNCFDLLGEWHAYFNDDSQENNKSYQEDYFKEICGEIFSERLNMCPEGVWFQEEMSALKHCSPVQESTDTIARLQLWHVRLASATLHTQQVISASNLCKEINAMTYDDPGYVAASCRIHMAKGNLQLVRHFLDLYPDIPQAAPDTAIYAEQAPLLGKIGQISFEKLEEAGRDYWNRSYSQREAEISEYINDCIFRGAIRDDQAIQANSELRSIGRESRHDIDKPEKLAQLEELERKLCKWDEAVLDEVNRRIRELRELRKEGNSGLSR